MFRGMHGLGLRFIGGLWLSLALLLGTADAHPLTTRNLRVVHFAMENGDLVAYFRISMPLLVGRGVPAPTGDGTVVPAPYTKARIESGQAFYYADIEAVRRDPDGLAALTLSGHRLVADGRRLEGRVLGLSVHPMGHVPPFDTVDQARVATTPAPWPSAVPEIDSGYVLIDCAIDYGPLPQGRRFELSSGLDPGPLGEAGTVNLLVDHRDGGAVFYREAGLLRDPVTVAPNVFEGFGSFVAGGVDHILGGVDHLLFVICLVIGAGSPRALAWRITGFTVGHSLTLTIGFLGLVPKPVWFEPGIEAAIALSIIFAGVTALAGRGGRQMFLVTLAIGLIHGFGFSFSIRDLLADDGPNVIPGLVGFNLGVEIGQLAVGLGVWLVFHRLARIAWIGAKARQGMATASIAVAVFWLAERLPAVWLALNAPST